MVRQPPNTVECHECAELILESVALDAVPLGLFLDVLLALPYNQIRRHMAMAILGALLDQLRHM